MVQGLTNLRVKIMTIKYNQVLVAANDYMLATDTNNEYLTLCRLETLKLLVAEYNKSVNTSNNLHPLVLVICKGGGFSLDFEKRIDRG